MTTGAMPTGRLVAVEGSRGRDIADAARRVWDALKSRGAHGGISWWDASGTFFESRQVKKKEFVPSPRTLVLFYAVDLQFRLKWEIEPLAGRRAHRDRGTLHGTIRAFGRAAGIPKAWLDAVLAPCRPADVSLRAKEGKKKSGWSGGSEEGFCETCAVAMANDRQQVDLAKLRRAMIEVLERRERRGALSRVRKKALKRLANGPAGDGPLRPLARHSRQPIASPLLPGRVAAGRVDRALVARQSPSSPHTAGTRDARRRTSAIPRPTPRTRRSCTAWRCRRASRPGSAGRCGRCGTQPAGRRRAFGQARHRLVDRVRADPQDVVVVVGERPDAGEPARQHVAGDPCRMKYVGLGTCCPCPRDEPRRPVAAFRYR